MLPYYKIERTEEGRQFFWKHEGFFNFWDTRLFLKLNGIGDGAVCLIDRTVGEGTHITGTITIRHSVERIDEDVAYNICKDFPEIRKYDILQRILFYDPF